MNEKTKKILMRELYMGAVALAIFVIVFALCAIFPSLKDSIHKTLTKDIDLNKVISLFTEIAKEII